MRWDVRYKRKQAPEPDGGGACVWILNLSLCSSVNALYHSNIEKNISQYVTINCNFYKCTFKIGVEVIQRNIKITILVIFMLKKYNIYDIIKLPNR